LQQGNQYAIWIWDGNKNSRAATFTAATCQQQATKSCLQKCQSECGGWTISDSAVCGSSQGAICSFASSLVSDCGASTCYCNAPLD